MTAQKRGMNLNLSGANMKQRTSGKVSFLAFALMVFLMPLDAALHGSNNPEIIMAVSREIKSRTATIAYPLERQGELVLRESVFFKGDSLKVTPTAHKYAAQIVVGGVSPRYQTHVQFINPTDQSQMVTVTLAKGNGEAFVVNSALDFVPGFPSVPASWMALSLNPKQSIANTFVAATNAQTVQAGWADFEIPQTCINGICVDDLIVQVVYDVMDDQGQLISMVGVPASPAASEFWVPIQQTQSIGAGLALANVGTSSVVVRIEAYSILPTPFAEAS